METSDLFCHDLTSTPQPGIGKVLVTGATGYIGGRLVPELLAREYKVRVLARSPSPADCKKLNIYSQHPSRQRLCHNSSSRPSPVKRGASRDPEVPEMMPFPWIPDLAMLRVARPE